MATLLDIHARSLKESAILSTYGDYPVISPFDVIDLLNKAEISFVLAGAHALVGWLKESRGTKDVDVIVAAKQVKKAVRLLHKAYPHLEIEDLPVVVRFHDPVIREVVLDVMKPNQTLYRETFKHTHTVHSRGLTYRIPSLEMAMTMKYSAMLSPHRQEEDGLQDAHDFIRLIKVNPQLNEGILSELVELVYVGAGKDMLDKVRKVRAGKKLVL